MKRISLLLSLMIILGFLTQTEARPIELRSYITSNTAYNPMWIHQSLYTNQILALSGTKWDVPLLGVEMGNFIATDTMNTIVPKLVNSGSVLFTQRRNNYETPAPVPEPSIMILMGTGFIGFAGYIKVNKRSSN
jgi:hypothetical protein